MWYVLDASDSSFCTVHEKNILQAGKGIDLDDKVTFFYRGKEYTGTVVFKDYDNAKCTEEMNRLMKQKKEIPKPVAKPIEKLPSKRARNQAFPEVSEPGVKKLNKKSKKEDAPQMSQKEKDRQRILNLNKMEAQKIMNLSLLFKSNNKKKDDDDEDWLPPEDEESQDSVVNMGAHKTMLKLNHKDILSALNNTSPRASRAQSPASGESPRASGDRSPSPSPNPNNTDDDGEFIIETTNSDEKEKEDLISQIKRLQEQLKEKENSANHSKSCQEKTKGQGKVDNKGNTDSEKRVLFCGLKTPGAALLIASLALVMPSANGDRIGTTLLFFVLGITNFPIVDVCF